MADVLGGPVSRPSVHQHYLQYPLNTVVPPRRCLEELVPQFCVLSAAFWSGHVTHLQKPLTTKRAWSKRWDPRIQLPCASFETYEIASLRSQGFCWTQLCARPAPLRSPGVFSSILPKLPGGQRSYAYFWMKKLKLRDFTFH